MYCFTVCFFLAASLKIYPCLDGRYCLCGVAQAVAVGRCLDCLLWKGQHAADTACSLSVWLTLLH